MAFKKAFPLKNYRLVNDRDFVTRIPYTWMGYQHLGECEFIDSQGSIQQDSNSPSCEEDASDLRLRFNSVSKPPEEIVDHVPTLYSTHIWNNIP
jgi:hypothetical protein